MLYYNRGVAALGLNKTEEAVADLQKVVERNDNQELTDAAEELLDMLQSGTIDGADNTTDSSQNI